MPLEPNIRWIPTMCEPLLKSSRERFIPMRLPHYAGKKPIGPPGPTHWLRHSGPTTGMEQVQRRATPVR